MTNRLTRLIASVAALLAISFPHRAAWGAADFFQNSDFETRQADGKGPVGYQLAGDVEYRYLGDPSKDASSWGVALQSGKDLNGDGRADGSVTQTVAGIKTADGRWFRFTFRGLAQDRFAVTDDDLYMKVQFYADQGRTPMDAKAKPIYPQVTVDRRNLSVNGDRHVGGAAVWRTYQLDFYLPFPQVDQLRLGVGFAHGAAKSELLSEFFVDDFSLIRLATPPDGQTAPVDHAGPAMHPRATPLAIGGRWFYDAGAGETTVPRLFDHTNVQRLLYHDSQWQAPFAGNTSTWLRAGEKDLSGHIAEKDQWVDDNVTVSFDATSMLIHTMGLPNHPTGRFPEIGFGNPNYIQEHQNTYYIPLNPKVNPRHIITATDNSNHALPMGPIGIAVNGVVFFNPFDAGSQDASNLMDRCCGHPAPDNTYHYHKYPICVNSPWSDDGTAHSPLIGWAFDGFPIYGPYESNGVMAKDMKGENALNGFNLHFDPQRGWHYHVTPGKFPYVIGGYWGTEDARDMRHGGMRGGGPGRGGPGFPPRFPPGFDGPPDMPGPPQ